MPRRRNPDLQINHERWLVSYADFITLLFAFFVVMYSISQVSESKYRVLSETLDHAFKSTAKNTGGVIAEGDAEKNSARALVDFKGRPPELNLMPLEHAFRDAFADLIDAGLMNISSNEMWLQIELRDSILFASGSADVSGKAREIFTEVSTLLKGQSNPVQIEGFTDNIPISNERYPSNWELSAARASAIVKWLVSAGVDPTRLSAVGYGEHQPLASNDSAEGRAQNRRVAIMIARHQRDRPAAVSFAAGLTESEPSSEVVASTSDVATSDGQASSATGRVQKVELEGGNLLFSSDPDLPRNER